MIESNITTDGARVGLVGLNPMAAELNLYQRGQAARPCAGAIHHKFVSGFWKKVTVSPSQRKSHESNETFD